MEVTITLDDKLVMEKHVVVKDGSRSYNVLINESKTPHPSPDNDKESDSELNESQSQDTDKTMKIKLSLNWETQVKRMTLILRSRMTLKMRKLT